MANIHHRLGWIGLGRMGTPMAEALLETGHDVALWNRTRARAERSPGRAPSSSSGHAISPMSI